MPPIVALTLGLGFIIWLLRQDFRSRELVEKALWVPFLWLAIRGSRPVTSWFSGGGGGGVSGNPKEALIAFVLICAAYMILQRRGVGLGQVFRFNGLFIALLFFLGLSCVWAPEPFVALKRWFKEFGNILIVLVVLTSANPSNALRAVSVRVACILFPMSVILIKFYPHLGRAYSKSGELMRTGVTDQKNSLGTICCVLCLCIVWDLVERRRARGAPLISMDNVVQWACLYMGVWLLWVSQSKTSLMGLLIGLAVFLGASLPLVRPYAGTYARLCLFGSVGAILLAGLATTWAQPVLEAMGRDATFTGRTEIWDAVLSVGSNPIIGSGFDGFWIRYSDEVWAQFKNFRLTSTHSGYIDMYLNAGVVGCVLFVICFAQLGGRLARFYRPEDLFSRIAFAFFVVAIVMNFSESYLFKLGSLWFFTVVAALGIYVMERAGLQGEELEDGDFEQ